MRLSKIFTAAAMLTALGAAAAQAGPGYATATVNMRTGPDIDFPAISVVPEGEEIYVEGCLRDESWCDVRWGPDRGWVFSEYIAFDYRGDMVALPDYGPAYFSIPFITFSTRDYWDRYYVGRPWYRDRDRWYRYSWQPRRGWHAPPPGPRSPGWWRRGYEAPRGMRPPPDRGWRRPDRRDGHFDRRDGRRDDRHDGRRDDRRDDRRDGRGDGRGDGRRDDRGGDRRDGRSEGRGGDHRDSRNYGRAGDHRDGRAEGRGGEHRDGRAEGRGGDQRDARADGRGGDQRDARAEGRGDGQRDAKGKGGDHKDGRGEGRGDDRRGDDRR